MSSSTPIKPEYFRPSVPREPSRDRKRELADRKEHFQRLLAFVRARNGFIVSIPGEREVTIEVLPDSSLPDELSDIGYVLQSDGEAERILGTAIVEKFSRNGDGELVPWREGEKVAEIVTHAGICSVKRFSFRP